MLEHGEVALLAGDGWKTDGSKTDGSKTAGAEKIAGQIRSLLAEAAAYRKYFKAAQDENLL